MRVSGFIKIRIPLYRLSVRISIDLDETLLAEAERVSGIHDPTNLLHAGLQVLIQRAAARRLARLGGTQPDLRPTPRRKSR